MLSVPLPDSGLQILPLQGSVGSMSTSVCPKETTGVTTKKAIKIIFKIFFLKKFIDILYIILESNPIPFITQNLQYRPDNKPSPGGKNNAINSIRKNLFSSPSRLGTAPRSHHQKTSVGKHYRGNRN